MRYQNDIMSKILFSEVQKSTPGAWIFFGLHLLCVPFMVFVQDSEALIALIICSGTFALLGALFLMMRLDTKITKEGISIKYAPFHRSFRTFLWKDVAKADVIKKPIGAKGGVGIKYGLKSPNYHKMYNVWGNKRLQLLMTSGRTILIGTQKVAEMEAALYKVGLISNHEH